MRFTENANDDHVTAELKLRDRLPSPAERRAIRERLALSRAVMAADVGVTQETILHWESGAATLAARTSAYVELLERLQATANERAEADQ